jgi:cytochrome P450
VTKPFDKTVEVILDRRAFIPFSAGPRICVGRLLALAELRASISSIVQRFDIRVAEGCNLDDWEENLEDYYVMVKKSTLPVVLTERM